jgi:hypothetical protein
MSEAKHVKQYADQEYHAFPRKAAWHVSGEGVCGLTEHHFHSHCVHRTLCPLRLHRREVWGCKNSGKKNCHLWRNHDWQGVHRIPILSMSKSFQDRTKNVQCVSCQKNQGSTRPQSAQLIANGSKKQQPCTNMALLLHVCGACATVCC